MQDKQPGYNIQKHVQKPKPELIFPIVQQDFTPNKQTGAIAITGVTCFALCVVNKYSSAIAERPRCRVGQFWPNVTGRYFADIIDLSSTTVV